MACYFHRPFSDCIIRTRILVITLFPLNSKSLLSLHCFDSTSTEPFAGQQNASFCQKRALQGARDRRMLPFRVWSSICYSVWKLSLLEGSSSSGAIRPFSHHFWPKCDYGRPLLETSAVCTLWPCFSRLCSSCTLFRVLNPDL